MLDQLSIFKHLAQIVIEHGVGHIGDHLHWGLLAQICATIAAVQRVRAMFEVDLFLRFADLVPFSCGSTL